MVKQSTHWVDGVKVQFFQGPPRKVNIVMEQNKQPVDKFYYSEREWDRLGCGPLPEERRRENFQEAHARGNPKIDGKNIKGYN